MLAGIIGKSKPKGRTEITFNLGRKCQNLIDWGVTTVTDDDVEMRRTSTYGTENFTVDLII